MDPERSVVATSHAPAAVGPYSQAIRAGHLLFVAGQIPLDPATGVLVEGGIQAQTRQVLKNVQAVLQAGGSDLGQVVKTTVFMTDLSQFSEMNAVYGEFFSHLPPARATVEVGALPKAALVEIEAIALCG
jgi:2-iminobutanoate/2-iminopropanoate deaminase